MSSGVNRFFSAETVVFWDLRTCPIPNGESPSSISDNIKSALKNLGYTGRVLIYAYSSSADHIKKEFALANIHLTQKPGVRVDVLMRNHVYQWWGEMKRDEPTNLLVIGIECVDMFVGFSVSDKNDNNLLLAHPKYTTEEIPCTASSIWLWDRLASGGSPFYNRSYPTTFSENPPSVKSMLSSGINSKPKTGVFWDLDHCPNPNDLRPASISDNIKSALNNMGYIGEVSINAYTDTVTEHIGNEFVSAEINLIRLGDNKSNRRNHGEILSDMCTWAVERRGESINLMLISKDLSEDESYVMGLLAMKNQAHKILLAQPVNASGLLRIIPSCIWLWTSLSMGGLPLGVSQVVVTPSTSGVRSLHPANKNMKRSKKHGVKSYVGKWRLRSLPRGHIFLNRRSRRLG